MGDEPMVKSTWERDAQVMEAIRSFERDRPDERTGQRLSKLTDLDQGEIDEILVSLADADYVHARDEPSAAELHWWWDIRLRERGRRAVGQWPSEDPAQALIQLLEERVALTEDPVERSRLEKVLGTVRDVGTSVLSGVLRDLLRNAAGI
jgi:hypothetical protein